MTLDFYLARRFLQAFGLIAGVFLTLMMLIDLIEQLRKFEGVDVSFGQLVYLVILNTPAALSEILPLLMILSAVILFVGLARTSELVVVRATGRSGIRALAAPVAVATLMGLLTVSTLNPVVAVTSNRYQQLADTFRGGGPAALSISGEGLWLRQGGENGQAVVHATGAGPRAQTLYDVTIVSYAPDGGPIQRIQARRARLQDGEWVLRNAKVWPLTQELNPETAASEHIEMRLSSSLTTERIRESLERPPGLSVWEIPKTIRELASAGFSTKRYEVWYQTELARPLFLVAMVLVGAAFTMRHARFGGTGMAVLASVLLGFVLYFVRNFAQILGENGQIPVALAAWTPPIASIMLAMGLLLYSEDG